MVKFVTSVDYCEVVLKEFSHVQSELGPGEVLPKFLAIFTYFIAMFMWLKTVS